MPPPHQCTWGLQECKICQSLFGQLCTYFMSCDTHHRIWARYLPKEYSAKFQKDLKNIFGVIAQASYIIRRDKRTDITCLWQIFTRTVSPTGIYASRSRLIGVYFAEGIVKIIFLTKNACINIPISMKFVLNSSIDIKFSTGSEYEPLSQPMMANFAHAYMHRSASIS